MAPSCTAAKLATSRPRRKRSARCSSAIPQCSALCTNGFGASPKLEPTNLYKMPLSSNSRSATGSVTTKHELNLKVVDFFDYNTYDSTAGGVAQDVTNYFWLTRQNLFDTNVFGTPDKRAVFCRVRKLEVYVLPAKGFTLPVSAGNPNNSNATGMFTVNFQVPGVQTADSPATERALATNTQVTNVLPQIDTFWKKVGSVNLQKTYQSGVVRPFFQGDTQCLFQMSIRNPIDGTVYQQPFDDDDLKIRVKVVLHVDNPISPTQAAFITVFKNEDFSTPSTAQNGAAYQSPTLQYVQMDLTSSVDHMR
jgi:hypothetical protein